MAYVVEKAGLHYAVIYEGVNPVPARSDGGGTAAATAAKRRRLPADSGRSAREPDGLVPA